MVRYSRRAELDLIDIGSHTLHTWGAEQASRYLSEIEACCEQVSRSPLLGISCSSIHPDLRRIPQGKHVIYYRPTVAGVVVARILHNRMLPELHVIDDEL